MDEFLDQFLIEGRELVQQASDDLLALEHDPTDAARIDSAFRAVHTLKGSAGLFDLEPMSHVLHAAEDLLGAIRGGGLVAARAVIDSLLQCINLAEEWMASIARHGLLPDDAAVRGRHLEGILRRPLEGDRAENGVTFPVSDLAPDWLPIVLSRKAGVVAAAHEAGRTVVAMRYTPAADSFFLGEDPLALIRSLPDLIGLHLEFRLPVAAEGLDPFACNLVIEVLSTAPIEDIRRMVRLVSDQIVLAESLPEAGRWANGAGPVSQTAGQDEASRTIRVDSGRIDALADIVGELIIAKNRLAHLAAQAEHFEPELARGLKASQGDIERLTGEMHRSVQGMRMAPLARIFRRFPRLMREIAGKLGKEVVFEARGGEVEADRSIVDGLFEPLLHVLRNAVDHGIESVEARVAAGKPAAGRVIMDARRDGDQIVLEVSDDGAGLDLEKIRRVAKSRVVMSDGAIDALDDAGVADLIFGPGFSTAASVTDLSGRGVGMDAVRAAVHALGGRVSLSSVRDGGSTVRLSLPQVVSITTVLTVRVGEERFGVPIESVAETARIPVAHIQPIGAGEAFVRGNLTVPLVLMAALLDVPAAPRAEAEAKVLIVTADHQRVGVEVDGFAERADVLVRPLTGLLAEMPGILGTALLGDGSVLLVLDLPELIA